jgi:hypothetical protein
MSTGHALVDRLDTLVARIETMTGASTIEALATLLTELKTLVDQLEGYTDGLETAIAASNTKLDSLIAKDFATQTTLALLLAKVIAAPATEAKQDTIIGHVDGIEAALATLNAKDFGTQTTLAAVLAKMIPAPATEAKQDATALLLGSGTTRTLYSCPASVNPTLIKDGAGVLYSCTFQNYAAANNRFVKLYDAAAGSPPTVGTSVPLLVQGAAAGNPANVAGPTALVGVPFADGLWIAVTSGATGFALGDTTAPSADDVRAVIVWR